MKKFKSTVLFITLSTLVLGALSSCENKEKKESNVQPNEFVMNAVQIRIARPTLQLDTLVEFYQNALGLHVIGEFKNHQGYDGVMLGLPTTTYHLEFTQHEDKAPLPPPTKEHLLVLYFDNTAAYQAAVARFEDLGIQAVAPENPYWEGKSKTYEDPDGYRIVLFDGIYQSSH